MVAQIRQITENETVRSVLDWTVFSVGVLSLTIAIAATILTHSAGLRSDAAVPTEQATG